MVKLSTQLDLVYVLASITNVGKSKMNLWHALNSIFREHLAVANLEI